MIGKMEWSRSGTSAPRGHRVAIDPRAVAIDGGRRVASDFGTTVGRFFGHSVTTFPCGHRVAGVTYDHPVTTFLFAVLTYLQSYNEVLMLARLLLLLMASSEYIE